MERLRRYFRQCKRCNEPYVTYKKFDSICLNCLPMQLKIQYYIMRPISEDRLPLEEKWFPKIESLIIEKKIEEKEISFSFIEDKKYFGELM